MTDSYEAKANKICDILNLDKSGWLKAFYGRGEEYICQTGSFRMADERSKRCGNPA